MAEINAKVGEHPAVVIFELEVYPEPKILYTNELKDLLRLYSSVRALAKELGRSISLICDKTKIKSRKCPHARTNDFSKV